MSDCCPSDSNQPNPRQTSEKAPKRHFCPDNQHEYKEVPFKTILHHLKSPWNFPATEKAFYFCDDPLCDVVYFNLENVTVKKNQLRTKIGVKEMSDETLICYCFGVSRSEAKKNAQAKTFIIEQTKLGLCSCSLHNPSGRCCLKDFPK